MKRTILITQEMIDRYGVINGDNDIIHYDADYAKQRGFKGTLAHGLMVLGYAVELATQQFGPDFCSRGELEVRFRGPVIPGDHVEVSIAESGELTANVAAGPAMVGQIGLRKSA